MLGVSILPLSTILIFDFGIVPTVWRFFVKGQLLATGRWFSLGTLVFSTNKTYRHDITEILLKVASNTINQKIDP